MALSAQQVESFVYQFRTQIQSLVSQQINQNAAINQLQGALNDFISNDAADDATVNTQTGLDTYLAGGTIIHKLLTAFQQSVTFAKDALISGVLTLTNALLVSSGGTGRATLTAHAVVLGEGTSSVGLATIGTSGRVLTDNGAGVDPSFKVPASGVTSQVDRKSTRSLATVYQNTGVTAMFISVWASKAVGGTLAALSDAANPPTTIVASTTVQAIAADDAFIMFIVLPNNYYEVTFSGGTIDGWIEAN